MTPIEEIIPLYLADRISLDSAVQHGMSQLYHYKPLYSR